MVRCAKAASVCQRVSSEQAPSTSPCQLCNWPFGALARTAAIISGTPATAATMRSARRRVGSVGLPLCMVHHRGSGLWPLCLLAQLGGPHQWRAALVVIIFDLAIETLEAFRGLDLAGRLDRPHRTRSFTEVTGAAAFRTALEQIEQVQPVERGEHTAERTKEAAIGALGEKPDRQERAGIEEIRPGARELRGDRGLEWLDLDGGAGRIDLGHHH